MTMHKVHITHWPDWHAIKSRLGQLIHDPRFWAVLIVGGVILLMFVFSIMAGPNQSAGPHPFGYPIYPYLP